MHRRTFLKALSAAIASRPRFRENPFTLGVASGEPTRTSIVLWTRLAPSPMEPGGGLSPDPRAVRWELATDENMQRVLKHGEAVASSELAHSVHVDVQGLSPGREYWYRFTAGGEESPVARTKTLPAGNFDFTSCSCQHYEQGYFVAYDAMVRDDPSFVLHLGDYIYDVSFGEGVRKHETADTLDTLEAYRLRHALYKSDLSLQRAHAHLPFFVVPDNHDALDFNDTTKLKRRAAAFQAWYEHMPIRPYPSGSTAPSVARSIDIGELARIHVLDTRQFRDDQQVCRDGMDPDYGFGVYHPKCDALAEPSRTMLGAAQETWLEERLRTSTARWNVIATTVPFADFEFLRDGAPYVYYGGWSAYPANRERVLDALVGLGVSNPVFVSGDIHSSWINEVRRGTSLIATELTTSSISSDFPPPLSEPVRENLTHNPHVKFFEETKRGYGRHALTDGRWTTWIRTVDSVEHPEARVSTLAEHILESR